MCSPLLAPRLRRGLGRFLVLLAIATSATALAQTPAYVFSHLAGSTGGGGYADGAASAAMFNRPQGVAFDTAGNLFVADASNQVIRKITPAGVVSTFAGKPGVSGFTDGIGEAARFYEPSSLTVDLNGNVYVASLLGIRRITPAGVTTTVTSEGAMGLAADALGNVYFTTGGAVCRLDANGTVTVVVGSRSEPGHVDANGTAARFRSAAGLAFDAAGNLYVADGNIVRCVTPAGDVSTVAGEYLKSPVSPSDGDGTGAGARFSQLGAMAVGPDGNVYVLEGLQKIRRVTPAGVVTTIRFASTWEGSYQNPGLAIDAQGNLYVGNESAHSILKVTGAGAVTVYAGNGNESGSVDGTGAAARFLYPHGVAVDAAGTAYVADTANSVIRRITPAGVVSTLAGSAGHAGWADGTGSAARFARPMGIAMDASGNVIVTDVDNCVVRRITPDGVVTTIAGTPGSPGFVDGDAATARCYSLNEGLAVAADGSIYVIDSMSAVRKISPDGSIITIAGDTNWGSDDGTGSAAHFAGASGLAVGPDGTICVADTSAGTIRRVTAAGVVTTLAGTAWSYGHADGTGAAAGFAAPGGIAMGSDNCLYVADEWNVRKVTLAGVVTTIAGGGDLSGCADGTGVFARFGGNRALAIDSAGVLYIADTLNHAIRKGVPTLATVTWAAPVPIFAGTALSATQLNATANLPGTFTYTPAVGTVLTTGSHTLSVTFTPTDTVNFGAVTKTVTLTVRSANYAGDYFGAIGSNGGSWALHVNQDNTGLFTAYSSTRHSAIVTVVTIAPDGSFSVSGNESIATGAGAAYSLSGSVDTGRISGQFGGTREPFTGTIDLGAAAGSAGSYRATALNQDTGTAHVVAGPGGRTLVVVTTAGAVESASGTLDGNGNLTATTDSGATLSLSVNAAARSFTATLTKAGTGQRVQFAGLADGVASTTRPLNMSARAYCGTGNSVTIGGFVVTGNSAKRVLIRAVGPTLTTQGIGQNEVLLDPMLEVHHGSTIVAQNDNWGDNANAADITAVGAQLGATALAATDTRSAAVLVTLDPGVYTFVVKGRGDTSGIVLLEAYAADAGAPTAHFVNLAARAYATTGNGVAIGGFVISGNAPKKVLMRAVGPTLTTQSIGQSEVLLDPTIELHHGNDPVIVNDDWGTNANQADIVTTGARIGATPFAAGDAKSSALLMNLAPGVYTFIAKGKNDTSGIVLVEVYDAD